MSTPTPAPASHAPGPAGGSSPSFTGRVRELDWLRDRWRDALGDDAGGTGNGGPQLAVLLGETGVGKSAIVQAFYDALRTDPAWNPGEPPYWPPLRAHALAPMRVNAPLDRVGDGEEPPRFLWLGVRWLAPGDRHVAERESEFPALRDAIERHAALTRERLPQWRRTAAMLKAKVTGRSVLWLAAVAADFIQTGGIATTALAAVGKELLSGASRREEPRDPIVETLELLRGTTGGSGASRLPIILWLDDAQWIDPISMSFVRRVWQLAGAERWPLLVVATHWEREWREWTARPATERTDSLASLARGARVDPWVVEPAADDELGTFLASALPGLRQEQRALLLAKAGGNYLTMVENVQELQRTPANFEGRRLDGALAPAGEQLVQRWESSREQRVRQRFQSVDPLLQEVLACGSRLGVRFPHAVVSAFIEGARGIRDGGRLVRLCEDPYAILASPTPLLCEFRDQGYFQQARAYFNAYLVNDEGGLLARLRVQLAEWINALFTTDGAVAEPLVDPSGDGSARGLGDADRRAIIALAMEQLPLAGDPDWEDPLQVAAVRGRCLAVLLAERDGVWERVRPLAAGLGAIAWKTVPDTVIDRGQRLQLCRTLREGGAVPEALRLAEQELASARERFDAERTPGAREALIERLLLRATLDQERGALHDALAAADEGRDHAQVLARQTGHPDHEDLELFLTHRVGLVLGDLQQFSRSRAVFQGAVSVSRERASRGDATQTHERHLSHLSFALQQLGRQEQALARYERALPLFEESLELQRALCRETPTPERRRALAYAIDYAAGVLDQMQRHEAADALYAESARERERLAAEIPTGRHQLGMTFAWHQLARGHRRAGRWEDAEALLERSLEVSRRVLQVLHTPGAQRNAAFALSGLAELRERRGVPHGELVALLYEAVALRTQAAAQKVTATHIRELCSDAAQLATLLAAHGDRAQGEEVLAGVETMALQLQVRAAQRDARTRDMMTRYWSARRTVALASLEEAAQTDVALLAERLAQSPPGKEFHFIMGGSMRNTAKDMDDLDRYHERKEALRATVARCDEWLASLAAAAIPWSPSA